MYLIDTSVWIESLKKNSKFNIQKHFKEHEIFLCLPVYQEILQGIRDDAVFWAVKEATAIYRQARKKGITIRSSVDCLIAAIAIKNHATIIHKDRDYSEISKFTTLKEKNIESIL